MLCWFCNKVKGKRTCPARGGEAICPRCCGTKRRVEIRCPENCPYLYGEHDPRWESQSRVEEQARFAASFVSLGEKAAGVLVFLHVLLLRARRSPGNELTDGDAARVIATLARTYDTRAKGIIYQHHVDSPQLQSLVERLSRLLEQRERWVPGASDADVLAALGALESAISRHGEQAGVGRSYLELAARTFKDHPELEVKEGEQPGLIIQP